KLEATKDDLTRLNDIINEIDTKVKNLHRQLKRYEKHQETTASLIESEVQLATRKIINIRKSLDPIEAHVTEDRKELEKIIRDLSSKEEIWNTNQKEFEEQESILDEKNQQLSEIREKRNEYATEEMVLKEQIRNINQTIARLQNDIQQYEKTILFTKEKEVELKQQQLEMQNLLDEKRESFKMIESAGEEIEQRYSKVNAEIQVLQEERFGLSRKQAENSARFGNLQENIVQRERELASIQEHLVAQKEKENQISESLNLVREKTSSLNIDLQLKRDNLEELENRSSQFFKSERDLQEERRDVESQLDRLNNQIQFYNGIIQSKEGFSPGLQYVLENLPDFTGIKGALSDLLSVDAKYYAAVEAVLKDISRLLVADNRTAALETLSRLAELDKGRVSIIPLDHDYHHQNAGLVKNLVPLTNYVKCDKSLANLKEFLFQQIFCCDDTEFDRLINDPDCRNISLVSDKGRFRDANGIFTGGSRTAESNVLLGRAEKLYQLESEADSITEKLKAVKAQLESVQNDLAAVQSQKQELSQSIKNAEQEALKLQSLLHQAETQLTESKSIQKTLDDNRISLKVLIENFKERILKEDPGKSNLDIEIVSIENKISKIREHAEEIKKEMDQVVTDRQNQRIELINLENKYRNIGDNLEISRRTVQRTLENIENARRELSYNEQTARDIQLKIGENQKQLSEFQKSVADTERSIEEFRRSFQAIRNNIQQLNEQLFKLRREKEKLSESVNQLELDRTAYQAAINEIKSILLEKYNRNIPDTVPDDLADKEELIRKVERFKRNLELIGMVNMTVKEEYEEENSRLTFLTEQRDDLIKSEKGLNDVISQIDNIAREQFREIFEKIRQNFNVTFSIFFNGGEADLKMVGDSDPLEAQIEIMACPSGKKMRSLKMLSAGEKALTAIALLFGIYQVKPSPFCILDEVDAPLDDANTRRFTNVIKTFSEKTQFIVVTHNKSTMSIADSLYGVTMAESGVSQIVSVKLE
ncbi:MAG: chromosome segregation protein SMC, partial [Candidatus Marinimicrobia bacterium]|nr:chromosome segregation protein SMC [Candidatus Neomarinimicrobiota bacterium]